MNQTVEALQLPATRYGALDRILRSRLHTTMTALSGRGLRVTDALGTQEFAGDGASPPITIKVNDAGFYRAVAANGSVGAGEAWMDGYWQCDDLVGLIRLLVQNRDLIDGMETGMARLGGVAMRGWHSLRKNTRAGSRRNIAAHYDLGNEFFRLFLSDDLMYSSALYAGEEDDLEAASTSKLDRI